jgi:ABC-type polysaccharide/polyol phosphate transport system ATPase subunit
VQDPNNAIEVEGLVKDFRVYHRAFATLKSQVVHGVKQLFQRDVGAASSLRRALNGISFEIPQGQGVALLGKNGSGKSTLLAILSRVYLPTAGEIRYQGKIASLLELGVGFNPELTGIENVFFSGIVRGLSEQQVAERYQSIVDFSELPPSVLDLPSRMYSSGMEARLAFSVATHIDSDIFLIDEALAVGDIAFQAKCLNRMREFRDAGKTIILVQHGITNIQAFADRAIWLEQGEIRMDGDAQEVANAYEKHMRGQ